jgi:hypothetical protein
MSQPVRGPGCHVVEHWVLMQVLMWGRWDEQRRTELFPPYDELKL